MAVGAGAGLRGLWNAIRSGGRGYATRFSYFGRNNAGVSITHDIALQQSFVWACIDTIASAISSTDWNVYSGIRGADRTQALPEDGLQYVLNSRFNPEMTAQSGKRAMMIAAVGFGNGVAEIERDLAGRIIGLWPLDPTRVEIRRYEDTLSLFYRVFQARNGTFVDLEPWEVFHIRGAGLTGFAGDDPIGRAIQVIASSVAIEQFAAAYFANGAQPGIVLEHPGLGKMDQPTYDRLKATWEERHQGARKSFRIGFMAGGMKLHQITADAEKAQLVEVKQATGEDICRYFHVPPHKVQHLARATNNNIEHQGLEFSRDTLRPWKVEIEQECDWSLIPTRGPKKFIELDVDWTEEGDYGSRMGAYTKAIQGGVFSVNTVLRKLGENTIGPEGDAHLIQGAMMPLKDVGKNMVPNQRKEPRRADDEGGGGGEAEIVEAWTRSAYQRIQRRMQNRLADLDRAGRADAERAAQLDALGHMDQTLEELARVLRPHWPDAMLSLQFGAIAVIRGATPEAAAADFTHTILSKGTAS